MDVSDWDVSSVSTAQFDDARPIQYIVNAINERFCGSMPYPWNLENCILGRRPNVARLREMVDAILSISGTFIDLSADYSTDFYASFPRYFSAEQIATSSHPMAVSPCIGRTSDTPLALDSYRSLLADMLYWLGRFRYRAPAAAWRTKRIESSWLNDSDPEISVNDREDTISFPAEIYSGSSNTDKRYSRYEDGSEDARVETAQHAKELSGIWIANEFPIPADVILVWMYSGSVPSLRGLGGASLPGHPGKDTEDRRYSGRAFGDVFRQTSGSSSGSARFGDVDRETMIGTTDGNEFVLTERVFSPDGEDFLETETRTVFNPHKDAKLTSSESSAKEASESYWTHKPGIDSKAVYCEANSCVCVIPEMGSAVRPPILSAHLPGSASDVSRRGTESLEIGPFELFAVLDFGNYYHFSPSQD